MDRCKCGLLSTLVDAGIDSAYSAALTTAGVPGAIAPPNRRTVGTENDVVRQGMLPHALPDLMDGLALRRIVAAGSGDWARCDSVTASFCGHCSVRLDAATND